ncbi:MAG: amino acid adenylation domain-containing protein [Planctomycetales bacterium]|nr:amino acid adenylation domain-containing protein [Planctomycetales bacterium]
MTKNEFLDRISGLDKRQLILLADRLKKNLEFEHAKQDSPIAIRSMACRFPGSRSLAAYWNLLKSGMQSLREVPPSRWDMRQYYDPDVGKAGKMYCTQGGFLEDIESFDPGFFGISPQEARRMDPQQRLLLETSWQAIENAGAARIISDSCTGVFVAISQSTYTGGMSVGRPQEIDVYAGAGNMCSTAAGRLSHLFGLRGPCIPIDTACSSSLVALHLAVESLRRRECDMALVAGVNLMLAPELSVYFCRLGVLSPTGQCRSFLANSDGYVRGEGCGAIVLQRLEDAQQERAPILATIRGTAVNHDGRGSGLTVPNGKAQVEVIRRALANASLDARDIDFLEGQGTATSIGDAIELQSIRAVFADSRQTPLKIGSVKSNIGHLETASGMASLIKSCLSLHHKTFVPQPAGGPPNEVIAQDSQLELCCSATPWESEKLKRIGINGFGINGTNAHVILEEAPSARHNECTQPQASLTQSSVLFLSAHTSPALSELASRAAETLESEPQVRWADFCFVGNQRQPSTYRGTVVAADRSTAIAKLRRLAQAGTTEPVETPAKIALVLSPHFQKDARVWLHRCTESLGDAPLAKKLASFGELPNDPRHVFWLHRAVLTLLEHYHLPITVVMGIGLQEFTAGCASGTLDWEEVDLKLAAGETQFLSGLEAGQALIIQEAADKGWLLFSSQEWFAADADVIGSLSLAVSQAIPSEETAKRLEKIAELQLLGYVVVAIGDFPCELPTAWIRWLGCDTKSNALEFSALQAILFEQGVNWSIPRPADWDFARWVSFPNTPFQRQRFWIEAKQMDTSEGHEPVRSHQHELLRLKWQEIQAASDTPTRKREQAVEFLRQCVAVYTSLPEAKFDLSASPRDLGIDSLAAAEMHHAIWSITGVRVPFSVMLQQSSTSAIIDYVIDCPADVARTQQPLVRHPGLDCYRPTDAQVRYWFYQQVLPDTPVYNNVVAVRLRGQLTPDNLRSCLERLTQEHEILRTSFQEFEDGVKALVHSEGEIQLETQLLTTEEALKSWATNYARAPYDLKEGPLWRIGLAQTSLDEAVLVVAAHHIILDGWSLAILLEQILDGWLYPQTQDGTGHNTDKLEFSDYAVWYHENAMAADSESVQFWLKKFAETNPVLGLPTDYPRRIPTGQGKLALHTLAPELVAQAEAIASERGTTLFVVMLSALSAALHRYSGQSTFHIGVPTAGRPFAELRDILGMFMNTVAVPMDFTAVTTWGDALKKTIESTHEALEHQDVPFSRLIDLAEVPRDAIHTPLFQVLFAFQNLPFREPASEAFLCSPYVVDPGTATFDLTLMVGFRDNQAHCAWQYRSELFTDGRISQLHDLFQSCLFSLVQQHQSRFDSRGLIPSKQQQRLLRLGRGKQSTYSNLGLESLFERAAEANPERVALYYEDKTFTFTELQQESNWVAAQLRQRGITRGQRVGLAVGRNVDMLIGMLGILKSGAAYVPLDVHYPAERLRYIIDDAELSLILTEKESRALIPECAVTSLLVADLRDSGSDSVQAFERDSMSRRSDDLAYVLYTSGSTGKPKGVLVPHRVAVNRIETESIPLEPHETFCVQTSINFVDSIWEIFSTWRIGRPILLLGYAPATDLGKWLANLNKHQVTRLLMVPSVLRTLLEGNYDLSTQVPSLRRVICTGERLPVDLVHRFIEATEDKELLNLYGTTETWDISQWSAERLGADSAPIGTPLPNIQVYVVDSKLTLAPEGANGELYIAGDGLSLGYWKRQALTATKYLPNPWSPIPGVRMFRTGDLARWSIDGQLAFRGRRDDQLTVRGYRLEPAEIEIILREMYAVRNAAVKLDSQGRLVAYCEPHPGETVSINELHQVAKQRLPEAIVPSHFVVMERLPLTPSGKIHRQALPDPDPTRPEIDQPFVSPRTETEQRVAKIWEQVLNLNQVGIHDDFFLLGGHSLLATQMISRVRETFAIDLSLQTVFERPYISELAKQLDSGSGRRSLAPITPAPEQKHAPVSYAQARLWFIDELYPGNSYYNLCGATRVLGALDHSALANALQSIVDRHDILRTTFENSESGPVQNVLESMPIRLEQVDLSNLAPSPRELELQRLIASEAKRPFNLRTGPVLRALLVHLGSQEHAFVLTLHHMIADGWSINVLVKELAHFYASHRRRVPSALPPLSIQFADFCIWQRRRLQEPEVQQQLDWWLEKLQGIPDQLNLPTDSPRPEHSEYQGASIRKTLSSKLSDAIKCLGEEQGTTPFMTMLTGWQVLLAKLSGQARFSVGVPFANRLHSETEPLIGLFANTLVFPADFSSDPTIETYLCSQRQLVIQGFAHQEVPFEELVEAINPARDPSRTPLFQTAFIFQNAPLPKLRMPDGLTLEAMELNSPSCRFDLELHCWEQDGKLHLHLIYDTELYQDTTLHRWLEIYQYVLEQMAAQTSLRVSDIELIRKDRQIELINGWNPPPTLSQPKLLHEFFEEQARKTPDQLAVVCGIEQLSYGELDARASQLEQRLRICGVRCGSFVAIFMPRTIDLIVALLGVLKSGAAYVPMDPTYPKERLRRMLDESRAEVVCTSRSLVDELPPHTAQTVFVDESDPRAAPELTSVDRMSADELAYVIYTSGSTGHPKGVEIRHSGVAELVHWAREEIGSDAFARTLVSTSICFDLFTLELYPTLATGGTAYLVENVLSAEDARDYRELTLLSTVPSAAEELLRDSQFPPQLKMILLAGEPLPQRLVDRVRAATGAPTIRDIYGPSEDTTCSTSAARLPNGAATIGRTIRNTRGYVLSPSMRLQPVGIVGELYLAGAGLARGYLRQARITAERFVPDPFAALPGQRMYRSGDLVFGNESGELFFQGRNDGQIKLRGFRVELSEIEYWLNQHPSVFQAAVCVVEHPTAGMRIAAFVVPEHRGTTIAAVGAVDFLREKLPGFMLPAEFHTVEQLPRTMSGKLNRGSLAEIALRTVPARIGDKTAPRTREEKILSDLWCRVLGRDFIGVHENFFDLGGHSLLAVQIAHELRKQWRLNCSLLVLMRDPTIAGVAAQLLPSETTDDLPTALVAQEQRVSSKGGLSREQKMMWTLQMLSPSSPMLNVPVAIRLPSKLESAPLERALYRLLDRHSVLRVRFKASEDGILQQTCPPAFQLEVGSFHARRDEEIPNDTIDQLNQFASTPFDLGAAPLLRGLLLNSEASVEDCVLCLVSHHLVLDGWSVLVLLEDLLALYCEETNQTDLLESQWIAPSFSPVQFRDFSDRQLTDKALQESSAQCRLLLERIQHADLAVRLPVSRLRLDSSDSALSHRFLGERLNFVLNDTLVSEVESFASAQRTSEHSIYLAAFEVLLSRLGGKKQFTLGGVLAQRDTLEVERLVGNLSRTIVYNADLSNAPDFSQVVQRVHDELLWHAEYNQIYFDDVARALLKKRGNLANNPVFDVMFTYQRVPIPPALRSVRWLEVDTGSTRVATTFSVIRTGDSAHCSWEYRSDLYQRQDMEEFQRIFESLLAALVAKPNQSVFCPPLVADPCQQSIVPDRRMLILRGARTSAPDLRVDELIRIQAEKHGEDLAIQFQDGKLDYSEVLELSQGVAKHLPKLCKSSASLGVEMAPSPQALLIVLACFQAKIRCVALSSTTPASIQQELMERLNVHCVISDQDREPGGAWVKISSLDSLRNFGELVDELIHRSRLASGTVVDSADNENPPARGDFVFHTSGSSGLPKSVAFDHARIVNRIVTEFEHFAEREVLCWKVRLDFVDSLWEMFAALCHGHSVAIVPAIAEAEIAQIIETLQATKVTRYIFTPSLLRILLNHDPDLPRKLPWLRCWYIGGEPLPLDLVKDFLRAAPRESKLVNGYGISEVWDVTACTVTEDYQFGCVGKPWDNVEVMVLDPFLNLQPHYVAGEIYVAGDGLALGYVGQPGLTAASFVPNPFSSIPGSRFYRTGDLGQLDQDSNLFHLGRCDQQVSLHGQRIEVEGIEAVLRGHPDVHDAAVVVSRQNSQETLVAYIEPSVASIPNDNLQTELRDSVFSQLPLSHLPQRFVIDPSLPRTRSGKILRRELRERVLQAVRAVDDPPRNELEYTIRSIWQEQLGIAGGIYQNYFELGGDSLLAMQMLNRLSSEHHLHCPLVKFFESPTIARLASCREDSDPSDAMRFAKSTNLERETSRSQNLLENQEPLWAIHELTAGMTPVNHLYLAGRLCAPLDFQILQSAVASVVRRHEALRLRFELQDGKVRQRVEESASDLQYCDLRSSSHPAVESKRIITQEAIAPFDLSTDAPFRFVINRLDDEVHDIAWIVHHLVADGWSMALLISQLFENYLALAAGDSPGTNPQPLGFLDYVDWYEQEVRMEQCERELKYWESKLIPTSTSVVPYDFPEDHHRDFSGALIEFGFDEDLTRALKAFAKQTQDTLFSVLMATLQVTVNRLSQMATNTILTASANRRRADFESIVGFLVNVVPIQVTIQASTRFSDLCCEVRQSIVEAFDNSLVSFDRVCALASKDGKQRLPSEIVMVLQKFPKHPFPSFPGRLEPLLLDLGVSPFDINIALFDLGDALTGTLTYRTRRYDSQTIEALVARWRKVAEQCIRDPDRTIGSIEILLDDELEQLDEWGWQ